MRRREETYWIVARMSRDGFVDVARVQCLTPEEAILIIKDETTPYTAREIMEYRIVDFADMDIYK